MNPEIVIGVVQTGILAGIFFRLGSHSEILKSHAEEIRKLWRAVFKLQDHNQTRKELKL